MRNITFLFSLLVFLLAGDVKATNPSMGSATRQFIENKGQVVDQNNQPNTEVKYLLSGHDFNVQLRQTGFSYDTYTDTYENVTSLQSNQGLVNRKFQPEPSYTRHFHRVDIELVGCNPNAQLIPVGESESYFNYFTTGTKQEGVCKVHSYQKVIYKNIYPNIDLEFFSPDKKSSVPVEYQFVVHPGGDPANIKLAYKGANKVTLVDNKLIVNVAAGNFSENIPSSYLKSTNQVIQVTYKDLGNSTYGFSISQLSAFLNSGTDLIIDPTPCLLWGTYFGGSNVDEGGNASTGNLAVDASGNVYITMNTNSTSAIATAGAYQTTFGGNYDACVAKFNPTGTTLIWATYYGGSGSDYGYALAIDASDNVYITGGTNSTTNIATVGAYHTAFAGNFDAFVAKFNPTGTVLIWATYYGGSSFDEGYNITLDATNNVYITGATNSTASIATAGAYQTAYGGGQDAFVAKFNSTGTALLWGTYYGGTLTDDGYGIGLDGANNVYISGATNSATAIATAGAYQTVSGGGQDAFLAKISSTGASLLWGTYYGGAGGDQSWGLGLDPTGNIYIIGPTQSSSGIATAGAYQTVYGGSNNAFLAKFTSAGNTLLWGTYYGGSGFDYGQDVVCDAAGNPYITGYCTSTTKIATAGAYQTTNGGGDDGFAAKFNASGTSLTWGTYYGGAGSDYSYSIALDASDDVFITGGTSSSNQIATPGEYQTTYAGGGSDIFIAEFACTTTCTLSSLSIGATKSTLCAGDSTTVSVTAIGSSSVKYSWSPGGLTTQTIHVTPAGTTTYVVTVNDTVGGCLKKDSITITVNSLTSTYSKTNILCNGTNSGTATVTASGSSPYTYSWSGGQTASGVTGLSAGTYTCNISDKNGCITADTVTITQPAAISASISGTTSASCGNSNGSATVSASGGTGSFTYSWTPGGATNAAASNLSAGTYTCTIKDANGCTETVSAIVNNTGGPSLSTAPVNENCNGGKTGSGSVTATGGTSPYTYNWSSGQTTSGITGLSAGTYTCTVKDNNGCITIDSVSITQPAAITITTSATGATCSGSNGSATATAAGGTGSLTYNWAPSGGTAITASNLTPGTYTCTVTDANGCALTASATVTNIGGIKISTSPDVTINEGDSTTLSVSGATTYTWSPAMGLSCTNCPNPVVKPNVTTTYCVVGDSNGCKDSACITITVESPCGNIAVPTAFSPNGDHINDFECVYGGCIKTLDFVIYDRWGNKVFETEDQQQCWDGTYKGQLMNSGVFDYYLTATLFNGKSVNMKGNITLVR